MATSLINKNSSIEDKIREFQAGIDYVFEEEKYHAPQTVGEKKHGTMDIRGYTQKSYKILSPELKKLLREILTKKAAILMSFDFKGEGTVNEHFRNDKPNNYYCQTDDEFGYQIVLRDEREDQPAQLSI
ncbi:11674_t:CDS:1 [Ambispora gerdemannii]|uniref:11674_t:CDS:1 n=1 Tax=Ambispora gerdemannii TaxID=144530 RepID=A0A9N9DGN6_9GLOM|nr:11674_t:CDS:1 [Ambispora gerdemannii]